VQPRVVNAAHDRLGVRARMSRSDGLPLPRSAQLNARRDSSSNCSSMLSFAADVQHVELGRRHGIEHLHVIRAAERLVEVLSHVSRLAQRSGAKKMPAAPASMLARAYAASVS